MTGDEKRVVVVHLGFSKIDKVAKNNLQSLKNSVLTCISHLPREKRNLVQLKPHEIMSQTEINDV